jgi:hypothetical protein
VNRVPGQVSALGVWLVSWNFVRLLRTKRRHDLAQ